MDNYSEHENVIRTIEKFIESLHDIDSPFEFATTLVKATAKNYKADVATLFRVSPSKTELIAEAGYDSKGDLLKARASYNLPWDATSESDMKQGGLTAWVAVSGKPLFVKNSTELLEQHPAHKGAWDPELHPEGPRNTFGCLYAVPLRIVGKEGRELSPKDSVLGVYKIERRKDNGAGIFNQHQIKEFDLAAKQISLIILLYERAMSRVLSDARHAVAGRLADAIQELEIMQEYINSKKLKLNLEERNQKISKIIQRVKDDTTRVNSWLSQSLQVYSNPTEREHRNLLQFLNDTSEARAKQQNNVEVIISKEDAEKHLNMTVAQSWDLHTLLLSLLNNAIQHSGKPDTIKLSAKSEKNLEKENNVISEKYIFEVIDCGEGIPDDTIKWSQVEEEAVPEQLIASSGTGLKRVFRVAKFREWEVEYQRLEPGSKFKVNVTTANEERNYEN